MMEYGICLHVNVYLDIVDSYVVGTAENSSKKAQGIATFLPYNQN